ncbi:phosphoglucosamine mutase, partial [Bacillus thuringiensis]|nr:phosphoglucosamine mutase [Bacillus thuringiensis]
GHIILLDYITTGDGMLSALQLVNIMKMTKKPLSELAGEMTKFPQLLVNVRVTDKKLALENEKIKEIIRVVEEEMNGDGRILVRP